MNHFKLFSDSGVRMAALVLALFRPAVSIPVRVSLSISKLRPLRELSMTGKTLFVTFLQDPTSNDMKCI